MEKTTLAVGITTKLSNIILATGIILASYPLTNPLIVAGVCALAMNEVLLEGTKKDAKLKGITFCKPSFKVRALYIFLGVIITYIGLVGLKHFGLNNELVTASAMSLGILSPHIIDLLKNKKAIQEFLQKRIK